jgi:formylglycine-generating enzyme required for sulfatase activity
MVLMGTGIMLGVAGMFGAKAGIDYTSTDTFCDEACHVHPHAKQSWIKSTHYTTQSGVVTHCIDCHLPAGGLEYYTEKARLGAKDIYGKLFKDVSKIDWVSKRSIEAASTFTYDSACIKCHQILFSDKLSKKGIDGHLHYQRSKDKMMCINCHLHSGHWSDVKPAEMEGAEAEDAFDPTAFPLKPEGFKSYTETIPGTSVQFEMVAIPGGTFEMGSPEAEPLRRPDEGPARKVTLSPFWIGRAEVRWREWEVFYAQRGVPGKNDSDYDPEKAQSGPTPPYGSPDQGWGRGPRPAITMTHHAATVYCEWLSSVTGKKFRLPTEAEWEYACRAGTATPYFFPGDPSDFTATTWWKRLVGVEITPLGDFAKYAATSNRRTYPPAASKPNPWGLLNVLGNVREFCSDWYSEKTYAQYPGSGVVDPRGPESGKEHVVRGGSFRSDGADLRSAARDYTRHAAWMITDPQSPKSIWWYSDCTDVGFRIVREYEETELQSVAPKSAGADN